MIYERLGKDGREYEEATRSHLADYADAGLRTLALAYRKIDASEYESWNQEFTRAKTYVGADRGVKLEDASELIEKDLILVGATGVEDKLQKGVCTLIVKIWEFTLRPLFFSPNVPEFSLFPILSKLKRNQLYN